MDSGKIDPQPRESAALDAAGAALAKGALLLGDGKGNTRYLRPHRDAVGRLWMVLEDGTKERLYSLSEGLREAGATAVMYYQLVASGKIADPRLRDSGYWRLLTENDVAELVWAARHWSGSRQHQAGT